MMKITSSQKLFLHNVLFHYLTLPDVSVRTQDKVEEIMQILENELIHHDHEDDDLDDEQNENVKVELHPYDEEVSAWNLMDLPPCRVKTPRGESGNLSFFGDDEDLRFDVIDDDGTVIDDGEKVLQIVRRGKEIALLNEDGDEKTFQVAKFPKEWTSLLKANVIHGVVD